MIGVARELRTPVQPESRTLYRQLIPNYAEFSTVLSIVLSLHSFGDLHRLLTQCFGNNPQRRGRDHLRPVLRYASETGLPNPEGERLLSGGVHLLNLRSASRIPASKPAKMKARNFRKIVVNCKKSKDLHLFGPLAVIV